MKATKPNTDQSVTLNVQVNGFEIQEFILPSQSDFTAKNSNILECFIPISHNDKLTVTGHFTGSVLHGAFDVLCDGSFLADKRIEGYKSGESRFHTKRPLNFQKVFDTPRPAGYTSIYTPQGVVEGDLHVRDIPPVVRKAGSAGGGYGAKGLELGVGSLAVVVSLCQNPTINYWKKDLSTIAGQWKYEDISSADGGIAPAHELEVRVTDADADVHINRAARHRRHCGQTRFGQNPWATFVFYYRTHLAIQSAGCIARPDKVQELEDDWPGEFIKKEKKIPKRVSKNNGQLDVEGDDIGESLAQEEDMSMPSVSTTVATGRPKPQGSYHSGNAGTNNSSEPTRKTPEAEQWLTAPGSHALKPIRKTKKKKLFDQKLFPALREDQLTPATPRKGVSTSEDNEDMEVDPVVEWGMNGMIHKITFTPPERKRMLKAAGDEVEMSNGIEGTKSLSQAAAEAGAAVPAGEGATKDVEMEDGAQTTTGAEPIVIDDTPPPEVMETDVLNKASDNDAPLQPQPDRQTEAKIKHEPNLIILDSADPAAPVTINLLSPKRTGRQDRAAYQNTAIAKGLDIERNAQIRAMKASFAEVHDSGNEITPARIAGTQHASIDASAGTGIVKIKTEPVEPMPSTITKTSAAIGVGSSPPSLTTPTPLNPLKRVAVDSSLANRESTPCKTPRLTGLESDRDSQIAILEEKKREIKRLKEKRRQREEEERKRKEEEELKQAEALRQQEEAVQKEIDRYYLLNAEAEEMLAELRREDEDA